MQMQMQATGPQPISTSMSAVQDGSVVYMNSPLFAGQLPNGASWMKLDFSGLAGAAALSAQSTGDLDARQMLQQLQSVAPGAQVVGTERVRGVRTTRYSGTIDPQLEADELRDAGNDEAAALVEASGSPTVDVWVDRKHLVRRMSMTIPVGIPGQPPAQMAMTFDVYDFGAAPAIDLPPSGDVFDATELSKGILDGGDRLTDVVAARAARVGSAGDRGPRQAVGRAARWRALPAAAGGVGRTCPTTARSSGRRSRPIGRCSGAAGSRSPASSIRRGCAGLRVVELGCGLGVPSLAAARAGAEVLATDASAEALALLRAQRSRERVRAADGRGGLAPAGRAGAARPVRPRARGGRALRAPGRGPAPRAASAPGPGGVDRRPGPPGGGGVPRAARGCGGRSPPSFAALSGSTACATGGRLGAQSHSSTGGNR